MVTIADTDAAWRVIEVFENVNRTSSCYSVMTYNAIYD